MCPHCKSIRVVGFGGGLMLCLDCQKEFKDIVFIIT